jgi:hypothetical protein
VRAAAVYVGGVFIGNASATKPVLYLQRGPRTVRVELKGFRPFETTLTILGEPNHQVLNVVLEPQ